MIPQQPHHLTHLDKTYVWHPFTSNDDWLDPAFTPLFIERGEGALLFDTAGNAYLDGNSSIWTNLHGHNHPGLNRALIEQAQKIAHSSYLGLAHAPGALLAEKLSALLPGEPGQHYRVVYSDDGSTAIEAALKIAYQHFQQNGQAQRTHFLSLSGGYHGDTIGAMSVGHSGSFHERYQPLLFPTIEVMSPACYRCSFNQAKPAQIDARTSRVCDSQCITQLENAFREHGPQLVAFVMEPLVQGAAGMVMHRPGYLKRARELCEEQGCLLILDEVLTGLGRTGPMLACHAEDVRPHLVALAKGLTGGYLPLGATLVAEPIFQGFSGAFEKTFFHGHSFSGHQLGCAVALENLAIFERDHVLERIAQLSGKLRELAQVFWKHPHVGDVRQQGLLLAIELVQDRTTASPFSNGTRLASKIFAAAIKRGLIGRGLANTLFLVPPYCTSDEQLERMIEALNNSLHEILPS